MLECTLAAKVSQKDCQSSGSPENVGSVNFGRRTCTEETSAEVKPGCASVATEGGGDETDNRGGGREDPGLRREMASSSWRRFSSSWVSRSSALTMSASSSCSSVNSA